MDNVLIAYLAFVAGTLLGFFVTGGLFLHKKRNIKPRKEKIKTVKKEEKTKIDKGSISNHQREINEQNEDDAFENYEKEFGTISLSEKISDKSLTFTDFNCVADEIDSDSYIKKIRAREDSAYNSLKGKIESAKKVESETGSDEEN